MEWTFEENKVFENAIAEFNLDSPYLFQEIAFRIPGKTIDQIIEHYEALVEDVEMIESGLIPIPAYQDIKNDESKTQNNSVHLYKKKAVAWTREEHESFLVGLARFGKGDWRSISRHSVKTRTPTQVASHAQKHFIRLQRNSNDDHNAKSTSKATVS